MESENTKDWTTPEIYTLTLSVLGEVSCVAKIDYANRKLLELTNKTDKHYRNPWYYFSKFKHLETWLSHRQYGVNNPNYDGFYPEGCIDLLDKTRFTGGKMWHDKFEVEVSYEY